VAIAEIAATDFITGVVLPTMGAACVTGTAMFYVAFGLNHGDAQEKGKKDLGRSLVDATPPPRKIGRRRELILTQAERYARINAKKDATKHGPRLDAHDAFYQWFTTHIMLIANPTNADVIPYDDWIQSYVGHCNAHKHPLLDSDEQIVETIKSYAYASRCSIGNLGEFNGGRLNG